MINIQNVALTPRSVHTYFFDIVSTLCNMFCEAPHIIVEIAKYMIADCIDLQDKQSKLQHPVILEPLSPESEWFFGVTDE